MNKNIRIRCNDKELVYSNRICCFDDATIKIEYYFTESDKLNIIFNFFYDGEKIHYDVDTPKNNSIVFNLHNFDNVLGVGLKKPVEIGKYKDKTLYMLFYVYKHKDANPILDVSMYLGV